MHPRHSCSPPAPPACSRTPSRAPSISHLEARFAAVRVCRRRTRRLGDATACHRRSSLCALGFGFHAVCTQHQHQQQQQQPQGSHVTCHMSHVTCVARRAQSAPPSCSVPCGVPPPHKPMSHECPHPPSSSTSSTPSMLSQLPPRVGLRFPPGGRVAASYLAVLLQIRCS